ncbi:MAG: hypothetical protein P1V35_05410 [Planctomycetota bacterium]|nr:hypothetical protein [Planctomycetota bacterium]
MSIIALLSLAATPHWTPMLPSPRVQVLSVIAQNDDVEKEIQAAGDDIERLLKLAASYQKASKAEHAKRVYQRVIELDTDHEQARKALRHQRYAGRWFESYVKLSRYKREELKRMKAKGLVPFEDRFVPKAELPFHQMGWVQDDAGTWMHPEDLAYAKQVAEWETAGYQFRADDTSWIAPEDTDKWSGLLWKCGEEWLPLEAADKYHSKFEQMWHLTGQYFEVSTTCSWNYANAARWHADQTHAHLMRLFGQAPSCPRLWSLAASRSTTFPVG